MKECSENRLHWHMLFLYLLTHAFLYLHFCIFGRHPAGLACGPHIITVPNDSYKFEYTCDFPCSPSYPHLPPQALLFLAWSLHIEFLKCVNNFVLGRFLQWPLVRCGLTFCKVIIKVTHNLSKLIMHSFVLFDALNNRSTVQAEQK